LGWELIATLASNYKILTESGNFVHLGVTSSLFEVDSKAAIFSKMRPVLKFSMEHGSKLFYYSHQLGVTPEMFNKSMDTRCWKITALSRDSIGKKFVAAAESTCRPYYGVQFHPEKNLFEWYSKADIPHSFSATEVTRHFIAFLGKEIRKSRTTTVRESWVYENDIHNYKITKGGDDYFYQRYLFPNTTSSVNGENDKLDDVDGMHMNPAFAVKLR
jgi:gamma-glutamyl hydrolase